MEREKIIKQIEEGYWPDWEPAPKIDEVVGDVNKLYDLMINPSNYNKPYFETKAKVITYLSMNCIEQFERGKNTQGMLSRKILEDLLFDLSESELEAQII